MSARLRHFTAVGLLVTAIDVSLLTLLRIGAGLPIVVADPLAIAVAAVASWTISRLLTPAGDPYFRWVREPAAFALLTVLAGAIDVAVLRGLAEVVDTETLVGLLCAKGVALLFAGALRVAGYRVILLPKVRADQVDRVPREGPPGDLRLSVVVPAFREGAQAAAAVHGIRSALADVHEAGGLEVVVVDDGSGDDTAEHARAAGADRVVVLPENKGKGGAVRAGVLAARGRTIAYTDADLSYSPDQILGLLTEVEAGWDVVVGSRRHVEATTLVRARRLREVTGRVFNALTSLVLLGQYRDTQCGLKAFRSDVAHIVFSHGRLEGFAFDVEIFHLVERYRLSLAEVPVTLSSSSTSTVHVVVEAGRMLRDLIRVRRWAGRGIYDLASSEARVLAR